MEFRVEHVIEGIAPEQYEQLYFDEPFCIAMCEAVGLDRSLRKCERDASRISRHVMCVPRGREVPKPVARLIGGNAPSYTEELEYVFGSFRGTWRSVSGLLTEHVDCQGTLELVRVPEGTKRVVTGEITVRLFGLGGLVERIVVADVVKSYGDAAEFTRRWLAEHPAARVA